MALAILRERLANFAGKPASYSVEGYSQSTGENIRALRAALDDPELYDDEEPSSPGTLRAKPAAPLRKR